MIKKWNYQTPTEEELHKRDLLAAELGLNPVVCLLLVQRGLSTVEAVKKFFKPSLEDLHDPFLMPDMEKAVKRVNKALGNKEKILIYGDYDVDGTTAVALVYKYLRPYSSTLDYYIPDRYDEGYGISYKGIDYAKANGITLVISLDCGIKAVDKIDYAKRLGIDFIICDHHMPDDVLPDAVAVLDAKRADSQYPYEHLSGCGVGFKFMQAFARSNNFPVANLERLLELLEQTGREHWIDDDTAALINPQTYENDSSLAWKRLKLNSSKPFYLALCQALAAYRENEAKRLNRPRKHIMRDEIVLEIAANVPETAEEMAKMRGLPQGFANGRMGKDILKVIAEVKNRDAGTYPVLPKPYELPRSARSVSKMLRLLLMIKSAENDVAEKLIATPDELDMLAGENNPDINVLKGWRYQIFGKDALELKAGKTAMRYNPEKRRIDLMAL